MGRSGCGVLVVVDYCAGKNLEFVVVLFLLLTTIHTNSQTWVCYVLYCRFWSKSDGTGWDAMGMAWLPASLLPWMNGKHTLSAGLYNCAQRAPSWGVCISPQKERERSFARERTPPPPSHNNEMVVWVLLLLLVEEWSQALNWNNNNNENKWRGGYCVGEENVWGWTHVNIA